MFYFLQIRNASDHTKSPAGEFGYPKKCDTSYGLEKSMYRATKELAGDANYTIFTGDIVDREVWHTSPDINAKTRECSSCLYLLQPENRR